MSQLEKDIEFVLTNLMDSLKAERNQRRSDLVAELKKIKNADKNHFWKAIKLGQHEFNGIVCDALEIPLQKNVYIVEHIVSGLYEHFIKKLIEKTEGDSCCVDKSRFITQQTVKALMQKENISLYDDYAKTDRITENKKQQAYWSPKTIPDTDTAMSLFWDWYLMRAPKKTENLFDMISLAKEVLLKE